MRTRPWAAWPGTSCPILSASPWKLNNSTVSSERFWTFPEVLRDGLWSASLSGGPALLKRLQGTDGHLCEVQHPKGGKTVGTTRVVPR